MKQKNTNKNPITKEDLKDALQDYPTKEDLKDALQDYPTKEDLKDALQDYPTKDNLKREISALETRTDIKMETMEIRIDEKAKKYRDQVLTVMDKIVNELKTIRQEQVMVNEHAERMLTRIENHETRITKLETTHQHS